MNFQKKEAVIWNHYKDLLENNLFDEYDILGLLIFIRRHLDKVKHKYIADCSDLIAHRERDRGVVMECIRAMMDNNYAVESGKKAVKGYHGITFAEWKNEWLDFAKDFAVTLSDKAICDLVVCVFSLMQGTEYKDGKGHHGRIDLFQDAKNCLDLCTTEGYSNSYYVCFSQSAPVAFLKSFSAGHIHQAVETFRDAGILHLRTSAGEIII